MTDCTKYQDDLKACADGELSPLRRFLVRRHLTRCASCREEIQAMTQLTEDLRATEPEHALPPHLRERLLDPPAHPNETPILGSNTEKGGEGAKKSSSPRPAPQNWGGGAIFRRLPAWSYAALAVVAWFVCYPMVSALKYRQQAQVTSTTADRARMQSERTAKASPQFTVSDGAAARPASVPPPPKPVQVVGMSDRASAMNSVSAAPPSPDTLTLNGDPDSLRQVHKEAGIGIQVPNPEATGDKINDMTKDTGGYVAANNLSTGTDGLKSGELIVKVPEAQFETFLASIAKLGTVVSKNVTGQDITDKTSDANQAQAVQEGDLAKAEARLKALGSHAKWEDQENTRDLRIQLAQTRARLKLLKRMAALGTITIDLSQTPKAAAPVTTGFLGTLQGTTHDALQSLVSSASALLALVIWLLAYSPIWLPLLLVGRYARKELKKREAV